MGVQSTRAITRDEAEIKYVEKRLENCREDLKKIASLLSDEVIENYIEETYDNYAIYREK